MRARCGRISRSLSENSLSTGADEADMQNNDSKSDLRSGYWSQSVDNGRRSVGMIQLTVTIVSPCVSASEMTCIVSSGALNSTHSLTRLALRDVSGFRK